MRENFPPAGRNPLGVDRDDDALRAEFLSGVAHEPTVCDGGRIDRRLIGAREQQLANVVERAHAATHRERHEAGFRSALDDVQQNAAIFVARRDVEKAEFVRAGRVIGDGAFDRIAGVAQIDEIDALDDAAVLDVETGDDAGFEHQAFPRLFDQGQRLFWVEPAVIERAAGDGAGEFGAIRLQDSLDVGKRGEAARGDDGDRQRVGEREGLLDVEAGQDAVARNIGVDNGGDARVLEGLAQTLRRHAGRSRPAVDRDHALFGVDADRDAAREDPRRLPNESQDRAPPPCR